MIERIWRDLRVARVYDGSSEVQQIVIARPLRKGDVETDWRWKAEGPKAEGRKAEGGPSGSRQAVSCAAWPDFPLSRLPPSASLRHDAQARHRVRGRQQERGGAQPGMKLARAGAAAAHRAGVSALPVSRSAIALPLRKCSDAASVEIVAQPQRRRRRPPASSPARRRTRSAPAARGAPPARPARAAPAGAQAERAGVDQQRER